jgi:hypothetical protein
MGGSNETVDDDVDVVGQGGDRGEAPVDHADALRDDARGLLVADLLLPRLEHRLAHEVVQARLGRGAALGAHEDRDAGVGMRRQQPLEHRLSHEAGRAGEEDVGSGEAAHRRALR